MPRSHTSDVVAESGRSKGRRRSLARLAMGVVVSMVAALLALLTTTVPATADTAPHVPDEPETVTADGLPTVQINGVVWAQVIVGNRVYVTGQFTQARPAGASPGQNETPRSHILAYNLTTGALITTWAPTLNSQGTAITASADGSRIFVGGDFSQVSGVNRNRIVALDAQTGAVISSFNPSANTRVASLAVNGNTLYLGGHFTTVAGQSRTRLAAVNATTGALLPWAPSADREIVSMVAHPGSGRVIVGGSFSFMNGLSQRGMTSLDGTTGAVMPWAANQVVQNYGTNTQISGLITDGDRIYGVGWAFFGAGGTTANFEGTFSADPLTGEIDWINGCRGDQFGVAESRDVLYTTGHAHDCGMVDNLPQHSPTAEQRAVAIDKRGSTRGLYNAFGPPSVWQPFRGMPASETLHWLPTMAAGTYTGSFQAGYSVVANDQYVVYGGEFPRVNGVAQQGLVRYAVKGTAPNNQGPLGVVAPRLTAMGPGTVRVEWTGNWDRDNERLKYEILRGPTTGTSTVLATYQLDTNWWTLPPMGFLDTTAPPGTNQTYRVRVTDPLGNGGPSAAATISIPSGAPVASSYRESVRDNGAIHHWRLDEPSGTLARDTVRSNDLQLTSTATRGVSGALANEDNAATSFPTSTSTSEVRGTTSWWQGGPQTFSVEAWFRTTTLLGGKIIGFGSSRTGRSNSNLTDRHVYMTNTGQLHFGLRPDFGTRQTINSGIGLNDGQWHHVVATLDGSGARLYVDGELAATNTNLTKAQVYYGYWRVGGDRLSSWPSAPTTEAFAGSIDEVAVYPSALSLGQVRANYQAAGFGDFPNEPPTASFEVTDVDFLDVSLDGSASSDPDGSISSYTWDFGDGATGTGQQVNHTYTEAGTYTVSLTVTDNHGATDTTTDEVTVTEPPPNQPPTASFEVTNIDFLDVSLDGSASSDPDGSISSYTWDFGDGATGTGQQVNHTYPAAGTYTVSLTVTDDRGATDTATDEVTVTEPPGSQPFAADTFGRSVANGWGIADVGGSWSLTGSGFSVSGGAGRAQFAASQTRAAYLTDATARDFDLVADVSLNQASSGGGAYLTLLGRRVSSGNDYRVKVRYMANGEVIAYLARAVNGTETILQWTTVPGLTASAGDVLRVRLQAAGDTTTTVSAKVWRAGADEPGSWLLANTSATPTALQTAGHVGLVAYLSGSWGSGPTVLTVDNVAAVPPAAD